MEQNLAYISAFRRRYISCVSHSVLSGKTLLSKHQVHETAFFTLRRIVSLLVVVSSPCSVLATTQSSGSILLLDTSMFPSQQQWLFSTGVNGSSQLGGPLVESLTSSMYEMSTIEVAGPSSSSVKGPMHFWGKDSGISAGNAFYVEFDLQVIAAKSNPHDAGIGFSLAMTNAAPPFFFDRYMRDTMITFEEDRIGFGDRTSTFDIDTRQLNAYRISVTESNHLQVYANGILALERPGFMSTGIVGFGDSTNDIGFDGHFLISSITLVIPEPSSICLVALCFSFGLVKRSSKGLLCSL